MALPKPQLHSLMERHLQANGQSLPSTGLIMKSHCQIILLDHISTILTWAFKL